MRFIYVLTAWALVGALHPPISYKYLDAIIANFHFFFWLPFSLFLCFIWASIRLPANLIEPTTHQDRKLFRHIFFIFFFPFASHPFWFIGRCIIKWALRSGRSGRSEIIFPNHNHIERPTVAIYIVIELPEDADTEQNSNLDFCLRANEIFLFYFKCFVSHSCLY